MLWELEIRPAGRDADRERVCDEFDLLAHAQRGGDLVTASARGFLLEGNLAESELERLTTEMLVDPLVEAGEMRPLGARTGHYFTVLLKPGVMDPVAQTILDLARMLKIRVAAVRTFRRYYGPPEISSTDRDVLFRKVLANDAIEQIVVGPVKADHLGIGSKYAFQLVTLSLLNLDDAGLVKLSKDGMLALTLDEMKTVQSHFKSLGREPTDCELETIAQTWSEHCSHKTLKGTIHLWEGEAPAEPSHQGWEGEAPAEPSGIEAPAEPSGIEAPAEPSGIEAPAEPSGIEAPAEPSGIEAPAEPSGIEAPAEPSGIEAPAEPSGIGSAGASPSQKGARLLRTYKNLLKETVFAATQEIRQKLGDADWCVSVFSDNAGIVTFDDENHVCFKVETHNHPSAIEPYGGANTGLGGVIRDVLGTGLAARPVCNTDVFCFANPDFASDQLPQGVLHPRRVMKGVVAGVRDYGNRMGIPTVNGAILFDDRYLANPLVFCGTVGIMPKEAAFKQVHPGDLIVAVGGRTGRDGIHGATFSSLELTHESETISGGAVQIGNAITEKKVQDVILQARDRGLFTALTDCGAGGFSSAVGEMGAEIGAVVELNNAPLKYEGLSYTEIWISESQERMVLSVPPEKWPALKRLCDGEDVEAAVLGIFEASGRLKLRFQGHTVADLDMHFLHEGRPTQVRNAVHMQSPPVATGGLAFGSAQEILVKILGSYSVCSKEWVIRQYDHEVQSGSAVKPLVGVANDGPSDAAVVMPVLGSFTGLAIGNGINPLYGDIDPYHMAAAAIDEALRNVVAVGADPKRTAILDNFCWGNVNDPRVLGSLVRAAEACRDVAIAFGTPFISGKDSLNNTYAGKHGERLDIPHTLLISALGHVADCRRCVTMDLKEPGNDLYVVGITRNELGGSHAHLVTGQTGGAVPKVDLELAPKIFAAVHAAITQGLVRACHDLSEGGFAVAIAEMAFAGGIGVDIPDLVKFAGVENESDEVRLFSESTTRFIIEAKPEHAASLAQCFGTVPMVRVGRTLSEPRLRVAGANGEWLLWVKLSELKEAWQKPLRW